MPDRNGFYWCRAQEDNTDFIAYHEGGEWFIPGMREPVKISDLEILELVRGPSDATGEVSHHPRLSPISSAPHHKVVNVVIEAIHNGRTWFAHPIEGGFPLRPQPKVWLP